MNGQARVMVATNAFGLGIDKADIRFVVHYQMPAGLDAYYQEAGRAGRDGQPADCTLLFLRSDKAVQQFFMGGRYPSAADVDAVYRALLRSPDDEGARSGWTLPQLHDALDLPLNKLKVALSLLRRQKVAVQDKQSRLSLKSAALDDAGLQSLMNAYLQKREQDKAALEDMVDYAQTGQCRWHVLRAHFHHGLAGGELPAPCGHCDNCRRIGALNAELAAQAQLSERAADTVQALSASVPADQAPTPAATGLPPVVALPAFQADDMVKVKRYGQGRVVSADAQSVTVQFAAGDERSFQIGFVRLVAGRREAVSSHAPV